MTHSLWLGGAEEYARSLEKEFGPQLDDLRTRHSLAQGTERAAIESELKRVEADYKAKLDAIRHSLF